MPEKAVKKKPAAKAAPKKKAAAPRARKPKAPATKKAAAEATPGQVEVLNAENQSIGAVQLAPEIFAVRVNNHLLYEAVKQYRAGARRGTHMTKNRALVSGSGRKPWKQKGTGRARVGETRTPLWRHGGTVFGPVPRDYSYTMPKKARAAALRSALSQRVGEGAFRVVADFTVQAESEARPRFAHQLRQLLLKWGVAGKTLLVDHEPTDALVLSGRNLPDVKVLDPSHVTVYDVLDCRTVLVSQEGLKKLEERLTP
jgi:large subunit ribosomal protein L4